MSESPDGQRLTDCKYLWAHNFFPLCTFDVHSHFTEALSGALKEAMPAYFPNQCCLPENADADSANGGSWSSPGLP